MSDLRARLHSARSRIFRRASNRFESFDAAVSSSPGSSNGNNHQPESPSQRSEPSAYSPQPTIHNPKSSEPPAQPQSSGPAGFPQLVVEAPSPDPTPPPARAAAAASPSHPNPIASLPTPESRPSSPRAPSSSVNRSSRPYQPNVGNPTPESSVSPPSQASKLQSPALPADYFVQGVSASHLNNAMAAQKVWIKRAGASPTLVQVSPDDLVDDVRDKVLRKYANSLGRTFDAPDVSVRIFPREKSQPERNLSPEEPILSIINACFPGGQHIEEALLIDVPRRRTPMPSPRIMNLNNVGGYFEDHRPSESGQGYFPPMPPYASSPHHSQSAASHESRPSHPPDNPHSISVLETGQLPVLPSPRENPRRSYHRPKYSRNHTSSPTVIASAGHSVNTNTQMHASRQSWVRTDGDLVRRSTHAPTIAPLPTPPAPDVTSKAISNKASTPPIGGLNSPRLSKTKKSRKHQTTDAEHQSTNGRKDSRSHPQMPLGFIDPTIPPINVLIVEDNVINLRLLEAFTRRLKVRWQTAMNGRDAVSKWRTGGFHLVLMDIQLPIMSGLEATKEIRRLERLNGIGVFAKSELDEATPARHEGNNGETSEEQPQGDDKLKDDALFKSPVIIVALTASSLQSDRHEALAAGCNDFLTKPVHFPWLERKVKEWGCMQALIDFDGWRKWKDLAAAADKEKKREEDLDPGLKAKREQKEAKRAQLLARVGGAS